MGLYKIGKWICYKKSVVAFIATLIDILFKSGYVTTSLYMAAV